MNSPAFHVPDADERNKLNRHNDSIDRRSYFRNFSDERRKNKNEIYQTPENSENADDCDYDWTFSYCFHTFTISIFPCATRYK